jgi:hypothetical protein
MREGDQIKIIKIQEPDNALHKNHIPTGFEEIGKFVSLPKVGEPFYMLPSFRTSTVQEVLSKNTFRTHNSIYRFELLTNQS